MQDSADVPEPVATIIEERVHDMLVEFGVKVRLTVPAKPLTGATTMVEVAVVPVLPVTLAGMDETVKSVTVTGKEAELESEPLVANIIAV